MRDVQKFLIDELARHGVTKYRMATGGKHVKLVFNLRGEEQSLVVPISSSDHRAGLNARAFLRRRLRSSQAPPEKSSIT